MAIISGEAAAGDMKWQRGGSGSGEMAKTENEANRGEKAGKAKRKKITKSLAKKRQRQMAKAETALAAAS
jgi:hypothetical protein